MIKFTPTHYCPVKNPNRLVKIGTCSILEVVKPLILNKKVPTMHYNSIFQQLFNFLPRHRFEDAVKQALHLFNDNTSQKNAQLVLNDLKSLVNGEKTATLIIEDPFGQSNVVSDDVEILDIPEEELKLLKTGFSIIEDN